VGRRLADGVAEGGQQVAAVHAAADHPPGSQVGGVLVVARRGQRDVAVELGGHVASVVSEFCGTMRGVTTRQPRWVYDAGDDPDPRFTLANERTFLAWVRTSLAMLAGGVALHALTTSGPHGLRTALAVGLIVVGALVAVGSFVRWARVERAMRLQEPLPSFGLGLGMTAALVVVAVLLVIVLV